MKYISFKIRGFIWPKRDEMSHYKYILELIPKSRGPAVGLLKKQEKYYKCCVQN